MRKEVQENNGRTDCAAADVIIIIMSASTANYGWEAMLVQRRQQQRWHDAGARSIVCVSE